MGEMVLAFYFTDLSHAAEKLPVDIYDFLFYTVEALLNEVGFLAVVFLNVMASFGINVDFF